MDQLDQQKDKSLSRRDALKTLIAASGATALATLPDKWEAPMVKVGALPAFAQASPVTFPFTNTVSVTVDDVSTGGQDIISGWLRIYIPDTTAQPSSAPTGLASPANGNGRERKGPPYKRLTGPIKVTITYTFVPLPGHGFDDLPAAGTPLWCYGISDDNGPVDDGVEEAEIGIISNVVQVTFVFFLPAFFRGRFFFCSANFSSPTLALIGGVVLNPIFYFGPGLFGDSCLCPDPDDGVEDVEILANCYKISFLGVTDNGNNTSTWRYRVEELACAQDLSN
ncbi:MAG: hypothetical protein GWN55_02235, partial [Phycisphaerae bacterium]|nr:hypothetical protein [Phycisphaerae bacterium]NIV00151.1 hypothetical protein [Phycisphaerae bacterium]NIX30884.1 hypothetical protein [Phycisphaerae bacterium]